MASPFFGSVPIVDIRVGDLAVERIYVGSTLAYTRPIPSAQLEPGLFSLVGQSLGTTELEAGIFNLSGQAIGTGFGFALEHGSFALTGQSVAVGTGIAVAEGAFTVTGQPITGTLITWTSIFDTALTSNQDAWANYTMRQRIFAAVLDDLAGSQIRFTFNAPSSGQGWTVDRVTFGPRGSSAYDFASTPTEVLFSGVSGFALTAGQSITSDAVGGTFGPGASDHILAIHTVNNTLVDQIRYANDGGSNFNLAYKLGDETLSPLVATGYSLTAQNFRVVKKIEVHP